MPAKPIDPGTEWTPFPVPCGFCGKPDEGYSKQDKDGKWKPACWACVKPPKSSNPPKKKPVECPPMEDLDLDRIIAPKDFKFDVPRIGRNSARAQKEMKAKPDETPVDTPVSTPDTRERLQGHGVRDGKQEGTRKRVVRRASVTA